MDIKWLQDTPLPEDFRKQAYWRTTKGIISTYFSIDAQRWLNLAFQRIHPSRNTFDVTYP